MTVAALALCGWSVAIGAGLIATYAFKLAGDEREAVARVAHELRGPLTALSLGFALERKRDCACAADRRAMELELERAKLALADLAQVCGPRPSMHRREIVDVNALLRDCVRASAAVAGAAGVPLSHRWCGAPAAVCGQRARLAQALANLIDNAIEHGGVAVEVRGRADCDIVRIEVADGGAGLPAPVPQLARAARGARGRGRRGRGLTIVRAIAEQHGGRLGAAPSAHGAVLVLELPRAHAEERSTGAAPLVS